MLRFNGSLLLVFILLSGTSYADLASICLDGNKWSKIEKELQKVVIMDLSARTRRACINRVFLEGSEYWMRQFLEHDPSDINFINGESVYRVIENGHENVLRLGIDRGLNLNVIKLKTPLPTQVLEERIARALRKKPTLLSVTLEKSAKPLQILRVLVDANAMLQKEHAGSIFTDLDIRAKNTGRTWLGDSLIRGRYPIASLLIEAGASLPDAVYCAPISKRKREAYIRSNSDDDGMLVKQWLDLHGIAELDEFCGWFNYTEQQKENIMQYFSNNAPEEFKAQMAHMCDVTI